MSRQSDSRQREESTLGHDSSARLVLITGASRGIGWAAAVEFARRGDRVVAVARDRERLDALAAGHGSVVPVPADVTDAASMQAMVRRVQQQCGVPDVVVANAGIGLDALFVETTDDALQRLFEANVVGVFRTVRPFLQPMIDRGSGRILIVSSIVGKRGVPHYAGYSASKFALHGAADALRSELWGTGVSVGLVCPSSTDTEFRQHALSVGPQQHQVRLVRRPAQYVARAIVSMAGSRRREMILGAEAKAMTFVNALAPGLIDWLLARTLTRRGR
jgi:short-subunit dehydrogenase